ncbi:Kinase, NEK [Giardia muris]|uniref:non-specific serine/threonine protein kinase n=1 Tax=Giardia muris TaxID=5742 RepID=A0A4Z1T1L0_GIAMU|nr:Kinase, NEK [Giardia muris]|eukprot:TNJ26429.1 Kinase, NEK [Giardia muris]
MPETELIRAARNGDLEGVDDNLHEVGKQDEDGRTALMWAAVKGHTNFIPLLEREIGMQDNWGWTALMKAASNDNIDSVRLLFSEAGKHDKGWDDFPPGTTALMIAAHYNHSEIVRFLLPYEQGMEDSEGHTAEWYAHNSPWGGNFTQIRKLLRNEDTERLPPPPNPAEMLRFQERINELAAENDSLKKDLSSFKNAHEETKNELSQSNRENSSLKQQLDNAIEESKRHAKMNEDLRKASNQNRALINALTTEKGTLQEQLSKTTEDLKRALADQKAQNLALEKENARLRTEGHDMKDLRRRLEEVEEEKRILLQNLAAVGGRLPPAREDSSLISSAIQGDLNALRRHLDQAGQKDSSGMTALMHAASRGQTEVVRLLRPLEARLQDGRGWTALMHAVGEGHEECVSLLLLERDMKDGEGRTAAEHAEGEKMRRVLMHQPTLPRLPDSLSEYHLTAVLGEGMFGTVYAGHGNGRNVAVKVVSLGRCSDEGREKLRKEARMHLSLNHPNIIRCLGIGENDLDNTFVLVTELCYGDLSEEMNRRKNAGHSYTDQEVWKTIREVAAALAYLHEKRLVHRDLKPANILIASDDRCVLGDFGLIKMLGDSSRMDTILGTLSYMAPEIHREERYDKSVDVWALGVIGYEMCTHALPFRNIVAITEETPAPSLEGRPSDLAALISRMLSKDPKDRPTAREVLEEAERHQ